MCAQELDFNAIRRNPNYVWGQGFAESLRDADELAVKDLISQIYVQVDNETQTQLSNEVKGDEVQSSLSTTGTLRVSSNVSLSNCRRLVMEQGGGILVVRYIDRAEIDKLFEARRAKIFDLLHAAERAEEQNKVGDALRNYYWALKLAMSVPEEHRSQLVTENGIMLTTDVRERMVSLMDSVQVTVAKAEKSDDAVSVTLHFVCKGKPVTTCDYTYFDGYDWLNASVKDGVANVEMPAALKHMQVRLEYEFSRLWKTDPVVNGILEQMPARLPFTQADRRLDLSAEPVKAPTPVSNAKAMAKEMSIDSLAACNKKAVRSQADVVSPLIKAIETRQYDNVRSLCTENGWKWFEKLVKYGNAKIISHDDLQISAFANGYLVRGIKARFSFKRNNKSFVEDLVLYIKDDQIDGINFGLEQNALDDICRHSMWDANSRLVLVNFLENYKTAYALERLDYLNAVFSDDALIIVGNRLPQTKVAEITAMDTESYEHNKLTKSQYMQQLERVFAKQEYVNIQFEDATVKKTNRTSERYEIIIKQHYYSATYADKGYLYLLADISNPEQPVIYVRVWDEDRNNLMNYGEWVF